MKKKARLLSQQAMVWYSFSHKNIQKMRLSYVFYHHMATAISL